MKFYVRDLLLATITVALFFSGTLVLGQQSQKVRNDGGKKSAMQQYEEGLQGFRACVMLAGLPVLLVAAVLLRRWRTDDREAMADLGRVLGLLLVVLGLGIIYYGYSFTGGLPLKGKEKALPTSQVPSTSDLLLVAMIVALALGWWLDRKRLLGRIEAMEADKLNAKS